MIPVGRGQRELIIEDRQTGKDVVCVYVAIRQKVSSITQVVNILKSRAVLDYTIIVTATADNIATLQFLAPWGAALVEYFTYSGRATLDIYDDLSKQAQVYPGDVFYLHFRLLERATRLTPQRFFGNVSLRYQTQVVDVSISVSQVDLATQPKVMK